MDKVIVLSRVSTDSQDLNQQTQEVLKQVCRDGYSEDNIILIEDKESGIKLSEEERNGLNKLKEYIESDSSIKAVYIYELSRLSRRQKVLFSIREYLIEKRIQLISLKPELKLFDNDGNVSQINSILFSLLSSFAESEMIVKKERMMRGIKYNLQNGKAGGGVPPFGYATDKEKRYIIHPEESKILKRIYHEYINTSNSLRTITKELKEEGYFPKTSEATLYTEVQKWCRDKRYIGNQTFPQIISEKEFQLCQEAKHRHMSVHTIKRDETWLLRGLIFDVEYGMMSSAKCLHGKTRVDQYTSYKKELHKGHSISRKRIDPIVWEESKYLYKKYVINKKKLIRELQDSQRLLSKKIDTITNDINKIQERIDKLEERVIFSRISSSKYDELSTKLLLEKEEKERRYTELINDIAYKQYQIQDIELSKELNLEKLTQVEKVEIINKVIDIISYKRLNVQNSIISIYNKFNKRVSVYQINSFGKNIGFKIEERLEKENERPIKNFRPRQLRGYNYKGEMIKGQLKSFI